MKSIIKRIEMEPNRKDIKTIVFWFSDENSLPDNAIGRTVPQVDDEKQRFGQSKVKSIGFPLNLSNFGLWNLLNSPISVTDALLNTSKRAASHRKIEE